MLTDRQTDKCGQTHLPPPLSEVIKDKNITDKCHTVKKNKFLHTSHTDAATYPHLQINELSDENEDEVEAVVLVVVR